MVDEIKIDQIKGYAHNIAERVDENHKKDGILKGVEISVFFADCQNESEHIESTDWFKRTSTDTRNKYYDMARDDAPPKEALRKNPVERCDATYVAPRVNPHRLQPLGYQQNLREKKPYTHNQVVQIIADSWAERYGVDNSNGEFNKFVEKLYVIAKQLKVTKTNDGDFNGKYPSIEDQIVDELMGMFANESRFRADADSGTFYGVFQFSDIAMKELKNNGTKLPILSRSEFKKLSIVRQLDYMLEYLTICKNDSRYSNISGQEISPKQVYAMVNIPSAGNPNTTEGQKKQKEKAGVIQAKQNERGPLDIE